MKTILVVEDDPKNGLLYEQMLSDEGFNVVLARDGYEALQVFEQQCPDLVVLDIDLPRMNGLEVMQRMLARQPQLPVILNSAYNAYKDDFNSWSADAYVHKSGDLTELQTRIHEVLQHCAVE